MTPQPTYAKAPRSVAFGCALVVTLAMLGGIDALAARGHAGPGLMAAQPGTVQLAGQPAPCTQNC